MLTLLVLIGGFTGAIVLIARSMTHPTMIQVVDNARSPMSVGAAAATQGTVDGITFPDWSRWGWEATGGRTDKLPHGRTQATARYVRDDEIVTFSIVSGTGNVDDGNEVPMSRPTFIDRGRVRFELLESQASFKTPVVNDTMSQGTAVTVKRHVRGRTIVLTGTPATQGMRNQLRRLALRGVPAQQRVDSLD